VRQVGYIQGTNQHVSWKRIFCDYLVT